MGQLFIVDVGTANRTRKAFYVVTDEIKNIEIMSASVTFGKLK